jgi:uncharacterized protein YndB with AHSA1/START domain
VDRERVTREIEVQAQPEEVWDAVADAGRLGEWLDAEVDLDLRPGGSAEFRFTDGKVHRGRVIDVEAGRRLVLTWWPVTGDEVGRATIVTFTIEPYGDGARLRLTESRSARARAAA